VRPTSLLKRFINTEEVASFVAYVCSPLFRPRRTAPHCEWTGALFDVFLIAPPRRQELDLPEPQGL